MIPSQLVIFILIIYVLESLTIIVQSSLVVAVLGREWLQVRKLSPVDMILISLGICRFCLQWASILFNFCSYFNPDHVFWYISIIWEYSNILIFWLTGLLTVVYCVKVFSFTHSTFLWLRWRIVRLVPWLLLGSVMISCVAIIPSVINNLIRIQLTTTEHLPRNSTVIVRLEMLRQHLIRAHKLLAIGFPFLLFLTSIIALIASLTQHVQRMQRHTTSQGNTSLKAHAAALRSLATLFIFFTSYFLTILVSFTHNQSLNGFWYWVWEAVIYGVVSINSTSLMSSSPTLKRALKVKCWGLEAA
ncbi:taste receptor type 2 member 16 [Nycticebus coucang]|uniref:Taste receptor type 2 n=1 Tax=Nycticebus coucang TaxID=9470 RepID=A0A4Y1QJV5_NYCCO|nr:taste receptor type 2 member 16 [Nycticebus coucang]BBF90587.1 taste receptor, type 2, member 16 [Nycticebus coucang]